MSNPSTIDARLDDTSGSIVEMINAFYKIMTNPDIDKRTLDKVYNTKMKPLLSGSVEILTGDFRNSNDYSCEVYAFKGIEIDGKIETNVIKLKHGIDEKRYSFEYELLPPFSKRYMQYMSFIRQSQYAIKNSYGNSPDPGNLAMDKYPHNVSILANLSTLLEILVDVYAMVNPIKISANDLANNFIIADTDLLSYMLPMYTYINYWSTKIQSLYDPVYATYNGRSLRMRFVADYAIGTTKLLMASKKNGDADIVSYDLKVVMSGLKHCIISNEEDDEVPMDEDEYSEFEEI